MTQPRLRSMPSKGPKPGRVGVPAWGQECWGCQEITVEGVEITHHDGSWWHLRCASRDIAARVTPVRTAWVTLGHQLAASPRSFNVTETRAIVRAVLAMVHDDSAFQALVADEADLD